MSRRFIAILMLVMMATGMLVHAQSTDRRHITPVKPETNTTKRPPKGTKEDVIKLYMSGDTAQAMADIRKDSLSRIYPHYPMLTQATFGFQFGDAIMMMFGQKYGSFGVSGTLNMWNRIQPEAELGFGWAKNTPDDMNFTYKGKLAPYIKLGANYNFMFKSDPKYQAHVGFRVGFSTFKYDITDITYSEKYWGDAQQFEIKNQSSYALWGEVVAGLRVQVWREISVGWDLRYHGIFTYKKNAQSTPWFIPGYGVKDKSLTFTMSVYYTLPLSLDKWPKKEEKKEKK